MFKVVLNMSERKLKITPKIEDGYKTFSIRLKKDIVNELDIILKRTNRSRNELINICLEFAIKNIEFESQI